MHWVDDAEQRRQMVEGMLAWNTDVHFVYVDIAGTGLLVGEAELQGKTVVSTELGGGGHVTAATHRISQSGLANVLRHMGVLSGEVRERESTPVIGRATEVDNYLLAPETGLWETFVDLGDRVAAGQPVGQIHFLERPDREPDPSEAWEAHFVSSVKRLRIPQSGPATGSGRAAPSFRGSDAP